MFKRLFTVIRELDKTGTIDVEVEARDKHTKSHAGIFTRFHDKNIKLFLVVQMLVKL